jgi:myosin-5
MESKAKALELSLSEAAGTKAEFEKLQQSYGELETTYQASQEDIKQRDETIKQLKEEVDKQKNDVAQLKLRPARIQTDNTNNSSNEDVVELKNQIAALKTQLSQSLKTPKRQGSLNSPYPRNLSPAFGGAGRGISPERAGRSPSTPGGTAARRFQSPLSHNDQLSGNNNSDVAVSPSKVMYVEPEQMRPMSLDHKHLRDVEADGNPEEALRAILQDEDLLEQEILNGLIVNLKILPPNSQQLPAHQEVVFPAHNIGLCVTQMWRYGYLAESERLLFTAMDTIQKYCLVRLFKKNMCTGH